MHKRREKMHEQRTTGRSSHYFLAKQPDRPPAARLLWCLFILLSALRFSIAQEKPLTEVADPARAGGIGTVFLTSRQAFALPFPTLSEAQQAQFFAGNAIFHQEWLPAPAEDAERDGLGPLYNATSCGACHIREGRGRPPLTPEEPMLSLLLRLSLPYPSAPSPYGEQLHTSAITGVPVEGQGHVHYQELPGIFADGTPYALRQPVYTISALGYGPLAPDTRVSPRVAPVMIGLGLLEAVPADIILRLADPEDRDSDGISGRPNMLMDPLTQQTVPGRFGWKATQPTIAQQTAAALLEDLGITSALRPQHHCTTFQMACQQAPHGGAPEIATAGFDELVFYSRTLAVPARRSLDDLQVQRGQELFQQAQCTRCHVPTLQTAATADLPQLSGQTIYPYTDLLLHDMGEGLSDGSEAVAATGHEWRTPPLWGIGLVETVNGHTLFLHDGRARNLAEAILWHGGEASAAREAFRTMSQEERQALLRFLQSL